MKDYTHIRFLKLDKGNIKVLVDGQEAQFNVWYDRGSVFSMEKTNPLYYGNPIDIITYQSKNDNSISNEAKIHVIDLVDDSGEPNANDTTVVIINEDSKELSLADFDLNQYSDRIKIKSLDDFMSIKLNGNTVSNGALLTSMDIDNLFVDDFSFSGNEAYEIVYNAGNHTKISADDVTTKFSVFKDTGINKISETSNVLINGKYVSTLVFEFDNKWLNTNHKMEVSGDFSTNDFVLKTPSGESISGSSIPEDYNDITFSFPSLNSLTETFELKIESDNEVLGSLNLSIWSIAGDVKDQYTNESKKEIIFDINADINTDMNNIYMGSTVNQFTNQIIDLTSHPISQETFSFFADKEYNTIVIPIDYDIDGIIKSSYNENLNDNFSKHIMTLTVDGEPRSYNVYMHVSALPLEASIVFSVKQL